MTSVTQKQFLHFTGYRNAGYGLRYSHRGSHTWGNIHYCWRRSLGNRRKG